MFENIIVLPDTIPSLPIIHLTTTKDKLNGLKQNSEVMISLRAKYIEFHKYKCAIDYEIMEINFIGEYNTGLEFLLNYDSDESKSDNDIPDLASADEL